MLKDLLTKNNKVFTTYEVSKGDLLKEVQSFIKKEIGLDFKVGTDFWLFEDYELSKYVIDFNVGAECLEDSDKLSIFTKKFGRVQESYIVTENILKSMVGFDIVDNKKYIGLGVKIKI